MMNAKLHRTSLFLASAALLGAAPLKADFAFHDGDTVAFLGDSITAARGYTKLVEHYTMMRFPDRKIHFVMAGVGGDTATKVLDRLDRDVFDKGATVMTVALGINDINWGAAGDDAHKQAYLKGIRTIIERCREHKVRPIICSAPITSMAPDEAEKSYLQSMCDEGLALAKSMGAETIDLQRGMREIQRRIIQGNENRKPEDQIKMHVKDGIHLEDMGQLALAYTMLKGLGAPEDVSSAVIDARNGKGSGEGCKVSEVKATADGVTFTRLDGGLPFNLGPFTPLNYQWVPIPDGINRYLLKVDGLPDGDYGIKVEGRDLGNESAAQLAKGVNICSKSGSPWFPGGPWDVQSCIVKELVDSRDKFTGAAALQQQLLSNHPDNAAFVSGVKKLNAEMEEAERAAAKPYPYHFEIHRAAPEPEKK